MLYAVTMPHRTQLYLDDDQYRWLRRRADQEGSIAQVVRRLVDAARADVPQSDHDPLVDYLLEEPAGEGPQPSSVTTLDRDVYGE
jgi:hypothetical protein